MGFNPSWHKRCLSPWDSMVCIADGKYSEGKEIILGKERIHSIQRLQFFTKATNFLLCVKSCVTNSFRDSLCLRVRRARGVLTVIWPTTMLVASGRPKPRILLKRQYWKVKWHGETLEQHPTLPVSIFTMLNQHCAYCRFLPIEMDSPLVFPIMWDKQRKLGLI